LVAGLQWLSGFEDGEVGRRVVESGAAEQFHERVEVTHVSAASDCVECFCDLLDISERRAVHLGREPFEHRISSILLGDVATVIVPLSNRPVFVVPSTKLADRRNADRSRDAATTD
jgi:hypothetical protein